MKHTWFVPVAPLAIAAVLILTSFSLAYAQGAGLTINGTMSTGMGTALKIGLDPNEKPAPTDPCNDGRPAEALHVVMIGRDGERMDDCAPLKPEHLTAVPSKNGRLVTINSRGITPADGTSEIHIDVNIVNTTRIPITLGMPVIKNTVALIPSIGSVDHLPPIPPPNFHLPCYVFGPRPWVIPPFGSVYCGFEITLPLVTPPVDQSFSVRFPVLPH